VNRVKQRSRLYDEARPEIDQMRDRQRLARKLSGSIREDSTPEELRKMATLLAIPGRSRMGPSRLIKAIRRRRGG
jgi:hypothetical protein